jgi:hypothetical protein
LSAVCNLSFAPKDIRGFGQIIGQLLQVIIVVIMTAVFMRPLLRTAHAQSTQSEVLKDVIFRTAVGAALHVTLTICFMVLLFGGEVIIDGIGYVAWDIAVYATAGFPTLLHMAISHRDDKPLLFTLSTLCGACTGNAAHKMKTKCNFGTYRKVAIETFEEENNEVKRLNELDNRARESYVDSITDRQDSIDLSNVY